MTSHYDATYYSAELAMSETAYAMVSRQRAEKIQPYIKPSDTVFEFGVGSGLNLASLTCGARYGFDINPSAIGVARSHGVTVVDSCDGINAAYDAVICHHVLEHLLAPAECLATLRRVLKVGGTLLLFVPYEVQRAHQRHIASDTNYHLYTWSPHTLANLVIERGFKLQSASLGKFGYNRWAANLALSLKLGESGFRFLWTCAHLIRRAREVRLIATRPD
jgi:SAM-dependent methyltransferase